jgi:hypothetical protein
MPSSSRAGFPRPSPLESHQFQSDGQFQCRSPVFAESLPALLDRAAPQIWGTLVDLNPPNLDGTWRRDSI